MRDPALSAGNVGLEVGLALGRGADGLHAKHADTAISEPVHEFHCKAGKFMQVPGLAEQPVISRHIEKDRVAVADLLSVRAPRPSPER